MIHLYLKRNVLSLISEFYNNNDFYFDNKKTLDIFDLYNYRVENLYEIIE